MGVVNSTSSLLIDSQCGITDTQYNYTVSPRSTPCDNYTFTVTPVNIVGNGTSANVTRGILPSEYVIFFSFCLLIIIYTCIESMIQALRDFNGDMSLTFNLVCFMVSQCSW